MGTGKGYYKPKLPLQGHNPLGSLGKPMAPLQNAINGKVKYRALQRKPITAKCCFQNVFKFVAMVTLNK